jgi:pyruvate dehydrogenase (quinone)
MTAYSGLRKPNDRQNTDGRRALTSSSSGWRFHDDDGGVRYTISVGLPVKVVLLNNGTLGFVELETKAGGFVDVGCDLKNPNFAAMAEAMGIKGIRVEKPQDLEGALTEAFRHDGPTLVDLVSARQELVMPPKTTVDEAYHFGMFMMKAVLDGRAHELIDLAKVNLTR